jgi:2-polyprenyl-3-methyl-5-hydroxy-6-metoxy-1,4-benzoquinol methylase
MNPFNCYLCDSISFITRKGQVRDAPDLKILECTDCGLVTLSSQEHIQDGFYEDSGMHGTQLTPIDSWLKDSEWDDQRRFDMVKAMLPNKKLLDFGCGAGGFLSKARQLAASVEGIDLELRVQKYWSDQITIHPSPESVG